MKYDGKIHLNYAIIVAADQEAEGDRIFSSHIKWMESSHHREGEKALLQYIVSKAPELTNPMDTASEPTGNIIFILDEVYETAAGVQDHFEMAQSSWDDFPALAEWIGKNKIVGFPVGKIFNSLW